MTPSQRPMPAWRAYLSLALVLAVPTLASLALWCLALFCGGYAARLGWGAAS